MTELSIFTTPNPGYIVLTCTYMIIMAKIWHEMGGNMPNQQSIDFEFAETTTFRIQITFLVTYTDNTLIFFEGKSIKIK